MTHTTLGNTHFRAIEDFIAAEDCENASIVVASEDECSVEKAYSLIVAARQLYNALENLRRIVVEEIHGESEHDEQCYVCMAIDAADRALDAASDRKEK